MKEKNLEELVGVTYDTKEELIEDIKKFAEKYNIENWGDEEPGCGNCHYYIKVGDYELGIIEHEEYPFWIRNYR